MCVIAESRAVEVISSHQFEEEIGPASPENGLLIAKMDFSVRTGDQPMISPVTNPKKESRLPLCRVPQRRCPLFSKRASGLTSYRIWMSGLIIMAGLIRLFHQFADLPRISRAANPPVKTAIRTVIAHR